MPFLDWVNKAQATQTSRDVPYHLLRQVSVHGQADGASADNLLIQGDNLLALKALLPFYRGQIKCIFIDPPYNTQSAFSHYDDRLEHSQWLSMMYPRLVLLRELLAENGSIWVTLDDNEAHYCKVLMDEVFGRQNFVVNTVWQKRTSPDARLRLGDAHDHVLVYKKNAANPEFFNQLAYSEKTKKNFKNPDNDPLGLWASTDFTGMTGHATPDQFYTITTPSGKSYKPPSGRCWALAERTFLNLVSEGRVWFGKSGASKPRLKRYLSEVAGQNAWSWWTNEDVGHNQEGKKEINQIFGADNGFDTPKPERLIQRILHIATNPGDLVLDSFLGSGTTAAVAHKMGRRYIGIEMGDHAQTHCLPRLQKVIEGEQGGISAAVGWQGGGGFRFCKLGSAAFDADGVIHPEVKFNALGAYVWHMETGTPGKARYDKPRLGVHNGTAYYLLYNGILGDRRPEGGNVLTSSVLHMLEEELPHQGPKVIYGETTRLGPARLASLGITFKQIPYDISMR